MEKKNKEFFATSWAIDNKISVYVLVFIIAVFGMINYYTIPKEQIPEIVIPMININTTVLQLISIRLIIGYINKD